MVDEEVVVSDYETFIASLMPDISYEKSLPIVSELLTECKQLGGIQAKKIKELDEFIAKEKQTKNSEETNQLISDIQETLVFVGNLEKANQLYQRAVRPLQSVTIGTNRANLIHRRTKSTTMQLTESIYSTLSGYCSNKRSSEPVFDSINGTSDELEKAVIEINHNILKEIIDIQRNNTELTIMQILAEQNRRLSIAPDNAWKLYLSTVDSEVKKKPEYDRRGNRRSIRYNQPQVPDLSVDPYLPTRKSLLFPKNFPKRTSLRNVIANLPPPEPDIATPPTMQRQSSKVDLQMNMTRSSQNNNQKNNVNNQIPSTYIKSDQAAAVNKPKGGSRRRTTVSMNFQLNEETGLFEEKTRGKQINNSEGSGSQIVESMNNAPELPNKPRARKAMVIRDQNLLSNLNLNEEPTEVQLRESRIAKNRKITNTNSVSEGFAVNLEGGNEWRSALRNAWDEEISSMAPSKQAWYKQDFTTRSLTPLRKKINLTTVDKERQKAKLIKNMEKYKASLEKEFLNCGQSIRLLRLQEKDHRTKAKVEMKKLRSWHNQQIIRTYRNFLVAKLMKLKVQIELQDKRSLIINDSLKKTRVALVVIEKTSPSKIASFQFALTPIEALCHTPEIEELRREIKEREKDKNRIHKLYTNILKVQPTILMIEHRSPCFQKIVSSANPHAIISTYHYFNEDLQNQFDSLILDQRCRTGMKILRLQEAIEATEIDEIPPHEIVDFLQEFVDETATEFAIADEYLDILRLFIGRSVFPCLFFSIFSFKEKDNLAQDDMFYQKAEALRKLEPRIIDPILDNFSSDFSVFEKPISQIEDIMFHLTPSDMLMSLFETTETLTSLAKEKIPGDLGADDIFPLWLYTTIHINMVKLHSHLCFMENFCSPEEDTNLFNAACVSHIRTISVDGLIEKHKK